MQGALPKPHHDNYKLEMRQRITFIHKPEDAIDPASIKVTSDTLSVSGLRAVREDKITFGFEELPQEIKHVLKQSHELHIRYVKGTYHENVSPLLSRLSPGLHVYYSPQRIGETVYVVDLKLLKLY